MNHGYTAPFCLRMIAHYEAQASNWTKPESWRELARRSAADWRFKLERAGSAE